MNDVLFCQAWFRRKSDGALLRFYVGRFNSMYAWKKELWRQTKAVLRQKIDLELSDIEVTDEVTKCQVLSKHK